MRALSRRFGINPKTVAKWNKRESNADRRTGPTVPRSTVLSIEQEAVLVAFRKHTLLPLDDCLYALQATIPPLTRSSLHRCLEINATISANPSGSDFATVNADFCPLGLGVMRSTPQSSSGYPQQTCDLRPPCTRPAWSAQEHTPFGAEP